MKAWIVCLLAAVYFSYELVQFHMLNAISPYLLKDLQIGATEFGLLCSTYLFADIIFLLPAGIILDRFSVRKVILTSLLVCIAGTFGFALSDSFAFTCFCHFLSGIGNAFCFLSCMMLVSRWFAKQDHAFVIGVVVTIGMFGGVVAQAPFSLLAEMFHWRNALLVDGVIGVALFLLIYAFVYDHPKSQQQLEETAQLPFLEGLQRALKRPENILCGLYTGLMNLPVMVIGAVWGSLFLTQAHNLPLSQASFVAGLICMGTIVGSTLFGRLADRFLTKRNLMLLGACLSTITMLQIMYFTHLSYPVLVVLFFTLGLFTSSQVLGYPIITENNPPEITGTSMGIAAVIIMGLPAFVQPLTGRLIDLYWDGTLVDQVPFYSHDSYIACFWIFPLGFILSFLAALSIRERAVVVQEG